MALMKQEKINTNIKPHAEMFIQIMYDVKRLTFYVQHQQSYVQIKKSKQFMAILNCKALLGDSVTS